MMYASSASFFTGACLTVYGATQFLNAWPNRPVAGNAHALRTNADNNLHLCAKQEKKAVKAMVAGVSLMTLGVIGAVFSQGSYEDLQERNFSYFNAESAAVPQNFLNEFGIDLTCVAPTQENYFSSAAKLFLRQCLPRVPGSFLKEFG